MREFVAQSIPMEMAAFNQVFQGWVFHDYGDGMGVAFTKGTEFHFAATGTFRFKRKLMQQQMQPLMDVYGFLTTRVQHSDIQSQRINKLFGFKPTWADEHFQYSMLTALPFKESSCPQ